MFFLGLLALLVSSEFPVAFLMFWRSSAPPESLGFYFSLCICDLSLLFFCLRIELSGGLALSLYYLNFENVWSTE